MKTKVQISSRLACSGSVPLFFAYAKSRFSHDIAHIEWDVAILLSFCDQMLRRANFIDPK